MTLRNTPDPTLIKNWIAALRSGRYTQSQGFLRDGNTYCCLGVLCDLVGPEGWEPHSYETAHTYRGFCDIPPQNICDLANIGHAYELTAMNDKGVPFTEIADYIEQNILPR